jgi:hypothetical protein
LCFDGNDDDDDIYTLACLHRWVHEFKIGRVSIRDNP